MKPKFRAWVKENKEMLFVRQIDFMFEKVVLECYEQFFIDEVELMQYTGHKDKNGKEVFEGDIIKFFDCDGDGYTVPVAWDNDYACFSVDWGSNMLTSFDYLEEFYTDLKDIEVIGNIYENLSLLNEERKVSK